MRESFFFQELLSTVFNTLISGSRAFVVWSSLTNIDCCFEFKRVLFLPKWLTQGGMDCFIKTDLNQPNITIASVHSLRSLGQAYGRISLRSRAAPINLPSMRGVMCQGGSIVVAKRCSFENGFGA